MKNLFLLRGIPGSGKSTWIKQNKLENITLSSDKLRLLYPQLGETITQIYDVQVWKLLYKLLEKRMQVSQDVIIDATHYKKSYIAPYKELCEKYKYNLYIIEFDTDIQECKQRNSKRTIDKVPEAVIDKMYEAMKSNEKDVRKDYKVITKDEAISILNKPDDCEQYDFLTFFNKFNGVIYPIYSQDIERMIENTRPLVLQYFPILDILNVDHNNKYHTRTILDHSIEVMCRFKQLVKDFNPLDVLICLFHDIGKPFSMTKNKTDNYTHYYGHPMIGSRFFKEYCRPRLKQCDNNVLDFIEYAIQVHDINPRNVKYSDPKLENRIILLMLADALSHKTDTDEVKSRIQACKEVLC